MSGSVWMFSDQIDDEDMDFMRHEFVTYSMNNIRNRAEEVIKTTLIYH